MASETRTKMVRAAAALIGRRGVSATSLSDVLDESGAPRGSIYHHFPDGKAELAAGAVRDTSERVLAYLAASPTDSPLAVLRHFVALWRRLVTSSGGRAGCAIAGVAVDTDEDGALIGLVAETFDAWCATFAGRLEAAGLGGSEAAALARIGLASMEGALILCRARRSVEPLDEVAAELERLLPRPA